MTIGEFLTELGTWKKNDLHFVIGGFYSIESQGSIQYGIQLKDWKGDALKEYSSEEKVTVLLNDIIEHTFQTSRNAGKAELQKSFRDMLGI